MSAFKNFQDLIKTYCVQHKDVLHTDNSNVCFHRFKTQTQLFQIPMNAGKVAVVIFDFIGRAASDIDASRLKSQVLIQFMVYADLNDEPYERIDKAEEKALTILFDFYARLKKDRKADSCSWLRDFKLDEMTFEALEVPMLENHYGWSMTIPFTEFAPAYDAAKWNTP